MAVKYATVALKPSLYEHSSFVKFIERNWQLSGTLSERSRDNLPNPVQDDDNTYVPRKWAAGVRALYGTRPADSP